MKTPELLAQTFKNVAKNELPPQIWQDVKCNELQTFDITNAKKLYKHVKRYNKKSKLRHLKRNGASLASPHRQLHIDVDGAGF